MNHDSTTHEHKPYSAYGATFRCLCGAVAYSGVGPWTNDGTRGCSVCAAPTIETGEQPLCRWHRLISPDGGGQ